MAKWRNFYLRKMGTDTNNLPYPTYESVSAWGVWCKDIPFKIYDKAKEPAKRSWPDEHGDEEFIPSGGLFMEAYTMKVEFGCKKMSQMHDGSTTISAVNDVRAKVGSFLQYLRQSGMLQMYSSHTRIGRQDVRFESCDDDAKWVVQDGVEFLVFEVTFKVNDPVTDITLSNSSSSSSD